MGYAGVGASEEKPLWRRIADFPLVAMLLALAAIVAANAAALLVVRPLPVPDQLTRSLILAATSVLLVLAVYKLFIRHLGEQPRDELSFRKAPRELSIGLAFGFVLFSLVVGAAAVADVYNIRGPGGTGDLLRMLLIISIAPGVIEEVIFRGILFRWLEQFAGSWFALAATSALFGVAHIYNPGATWFSSFAIAIEAGVLLGGAYMLTRSLWVPIGLHAAWNFTQGFIYDVPVSGADQEGLVEATLSGPVLLSGGSFGLEASLIALAIATGTGVWLVVLAVRRGELIRPWWARRRPVLHQSH